MKSLPPRDIYTFMFISALFTIARAWKQPKCPLMDKEDVVHIYAVEYYPAIKKKEILPFVTTWMDPEVIMLSAINQTDKHKYCMVSLICGSQKSRTHRNGE
uniref:Uncharacterized protein n=1 Tax=Equus caballus TaxID=9796 RepID=A0A9L0RQE8_HORSE